MTTLYTIKIFPRGVSKPSQVFPDLEYCDVECMTEFERDTVVYLHRGNDTIAKWDHEKEEWDSDLKSVPTKKIEVKRDTGFEPGDVRVDLSVSEINALFAANDSTALWGADLERNYKSAIRKLEIARESKRIRHEEKA